MKKTMVALGLLLIGALTFGVISSSAIDPLASDLSRTKSNTDRNEKVEKKVLVQVGPKRNYQYGCIKLQGAQQHFPVDIPRNGL